MSTNKKSSPKLDAHKPTSFGLAVGELIDEALSAGAARTQSALAEAIDKLPPPEHLGASKKGMSPQYLDALRKSLIKQAEPGSILRLVAGLGKLAKWSPARTQREGIKLLLIAGYGEIPGLVPAD